MFSALALLISSLASFAGSLTGIPNKSPVTSQQPMVTSRVSLCYDPHPEDKITLKWPENFQNLDDKRKTLNPAKFPAVSEKFDSESTCQSIMLNEKATRNYIRVRSDTRISSCKTDEGTGPYASGECNQGGAHRGSCSLDGYADLRKVAEIARNGRKEEIFWLPFSHNVGCNYELGNNCGPGDRRNANLKDFIYVLKSRDAFDPQSNSGCPALWDAGSTNQKACSHYFDVYMAEDLSNKFKTAVKEGDPDYEVYGFFKQAVENCTEQATFFPLVPDPKFSMPPAFLDKPFVPTTQFNLANDQKIVPQNAAQQNNYKYFITSAPNIKQGVTGLIKFNETTGTNIIECPPARTGAGTALSMALSTPSPMPTPTLSPSGANCYAPIGSISFESDESGGKKKFNVYSRYDTPQTFYLKESGTIAGTSETVYQFTPTDQTPPVNTQNNRSLQLRTMAFSVANDWTWATPWCKPAIYLYPEKETDLNVKLTIDGRLTVSDPVYNPKTGWSVRASPNGNLTMKQSNNETMKQFPYLYYEADLLNVKLPDQGWVIEQNKLSVFLGDLLTEIGFNGKEISDFKDFWIPALKTYPYYFITLLPEDVINQKEKLDISVKPETVIRTRVIFEGLNGPMNVKSLDNIPHHERKGFVVTDWGGTLVGKSCEDITVK
ncbi:MAG: hypothetical protein UT63_C0018G0004 [Candidatus Gottesmanbacteria bacterium GW2011_GWC2_39_8]|uniref:Uncharacterized protein n=1 Tax=Candidatus Gottesmanbacteria bacterium GW2011_GWC2_39_8 TaxID=1618450 RepID=A0A0G0PZ01_9BACT|nr:MAG: hypothetical protein UT63_C0018G0004 [Candidatus Gottesmanbacteria bacterium GW2011_GWC2_39_8]